MLLVDLTDASGSFLPKVRDLVGRNPVVLVGTKVPLIPALSDRMFTSAYSPLAGLIAQTSSSSGEGLAHDMICLDILACVTVSL